MLFVKDCPNFCLQLYIQRCDFGSYDVSHLVADSAVQAVPARGDREITGKYNGCYSVDSLITNAWK